ncbi:MAG: hypothetical protein KDD53_00925 [Bdellovibrionales bacterium]|nr:hypothetical protein [Bdellovibrionales bacterium]
MKASVKAHRVLSDQATTTQPDDLTETLLVASTLPARPNALNSGLPSLSDINNTISRLALPITLAPKSPSSWRRSCNFQGEQVVFLSEGEYQQYQREFAQDVSELHLRVQRLKIKIGTELLRGIHHLERPNDAPYNWGDEFPSRQAWSKALSLSRDDSDFSQDETDDLIAKYNALVPEAHRLIHREHIASLDGNLISETLGAAIYYPDPLPESARGPIEAIFERTKQLEKRLVEMKSMPLLFAPQSREQSHEAELKEIRLEYRALLKEYSGLIEAQSWHSPTYGASLSEQRGPRQSSEPFRSDYQRFKMPELVELQRELHRALFRRTEYHEHTSSFLFNGGMAAFEATFRLIERDLEQQSRFSGGRPQKPVVLAANDLYFEVDRSLRDFTGAHFTTPQLFDPHDIDGLIKLIKAKLPNAVCLNSLSNHFRMDVTEITSLLAKLADWEPDKRTTSRLYANGRSSLSKRTINIVIDNTTAGVLAKWKNFNFGDLPKFIRVISIESLVKFAQDGLELAPAGLMTISGEYSDSEIKSIQSRRGYSPPENTVRKLAFFSDARSYERRMHRHSRNSKFLSGELTTEISESGFISDVIHPFLSKHSDRRSARVELEDGGGLFNIEFNFEALKGYRERIEWSGRTSYKDPVSPHQFGKECELLAQAFQACLVSLAREADVNLHLGTSFGFDTTRVAVYEHRLEEAVEPEYGYRRRPYLRVSPGTENIKEMRLLANLFKRTAKLFTTAMQEQRLFELRDRILDTRDTELQLG